jgi:transposase-like protein
MKNRRRIHSADFKARVALEAIKGIRTVQQIAAENELHPTQVTQWKTQMLEGAAEVFESGRGRKDQEQTFQVREERLERKIGQLVVEVDWLSKKCKELGIDP